TFCPPAGVTVTLISRRFGAAAPPRPPRPPAPPRPTHPPPATHESCNCTGSEIRVATPCRSPVSEWHELHLAAKYALPALASPTTMLSTTGASLAGGFPCPRIVNATAW